MSSLELWITNVIWKIILESKIVDERKSAKTNNRAIVIILNARFPMLMNGNQTMSWFKFDEILMKVLYYNRGIRNVYFIYN